jgi:aminopeptidase N
MINYNLVVKYIYLWSTIFLISACSLSGLNKSHTTPKRTYRFPLFTLADTLRGENNRYRDCYDVYFYNLNVDFNFKDREISGWVDIYFKTTKQCDTIQIDLYKNMVLDSLIVENKKLSFYRQFNAVFVLTGTTLKPSQHVIMSAYYHGKPVNAKKPPWEGGFVWSRDHHSQPWIAVACEVDGASLWWPVKDLLSDKPDSMKLNFTIPSGFNCISNGNRTDSVTSKGKTTYRWKVSYPINTYCATFYIGQYAHFSEPYKSLDSSFNLDFYVKPENFNIARLHFSQTAEMLHFYESIYGPYPWPNDGYKLVESPYEGMENQTAIAYGNGYKNLANLFDQIILHESAHEWWGNSVTVPDFAEVWIHEGMATYSEALFSEHKYGHDMYLRLMEVYAMFIKNKKAIVGPHDVNFWDYKDNDVYMKGALMLHTLRNTIGNDSVFFDILKSFYDKYKFGMAVTQNFIDLVNAKTGKEYAWFFKQYLYKRECPVLIWQFHYNGNDRKNELYCKWDNVSSDFSIPINVMTESGITTIYPTSEIKKFDLNGKNISLNTEGSYLALKRSRRLR